MSQPTHIITTSGTTEVGDSLSRLLHLSVEHLDAGRFPNQELKLRINQSDSSAILLSSFASPVNTRIIEFMLAADALRRMGYSQIVGVITYLAYSKQDKVFLPGEPLSAKVVASILQTGPFSRLYTVDLHNPSISGYFDIPVINLSAVDVLAQAAKPHLTTNSIVISPDAGSIKNSNRFAEKLNLPLGFATKHRDLETGHVTIQDLSTNVDHKDIFIFDDMIATGSTLIQLADFLRQKGAKTINIFCTHHLYLSGVQDKIDASTIDRLVVTNTITKPSQLESAKLKQVDIADTIAQQLASDYHYDPIS